MSGSYGSYFGLFAGPIGIIASMSKKLSRVKSFWIAHIVLVSLNHFTMNSEINFQCVLTSLASIAGLVFGLFSCADLLHNISLANGNCYDTFYKRDNEKAHDNVFNMDLPLTKIQKPSQVSL